MNKQINYTKDDLIEIIEELELKVAVKSRVSNYLFVAVVFLLLLQITTVFYKYAYLISIGFIIFLIIAYSVWGNILEKFTEKQITRNDDVSH